MNKLNLLPIPRVENITPPDFQTLYMGPNRPVVFKDLASSWPATKKWTPEYLKQKYGDLQVKVYNASYAKPGKHYMSSLKTAAPERGQFLGQAQISSVTGHFFLKSKPLVRKELVHDLIDRQEHQDINVATQSHLQGLGRMSH